MREWKDVSEESVGLLVTLSSLGHELPAASKPLSLQLKGTSVGNRPGASCLSVPRGVRVVMASMLDSAGSSRVLAHPTTHVHPVPGRLAGTSMAAGLSKVVFCLTAFTVLGSW